MNATVVAALARHILTAVGGGLLVAWGLDGPSIEAVAGAISTLAGVAWSVWEKRQR
jgi:hypothetical protein